MFAHISNKHFKVYQSYFILKEKNVNDPDQQNMIT